MSVFLDPHGRTVSRDQAMIGGALRHGFKEVLGDGEYAGFSLAFRDSAPRSQSVYLTDSAGTKQAIEAQRRQWMADKANAYRTKPAHGVPANSPPTTDNQQVINDSASPAGVAEARQRWLADKERAYLAGREG